MKKLLMMSAACFVAISGSAILDGAWAQGAGSITVIHEDGSQDVIDLGGAGADARSADSVIRRAPKVEVVPQDTKKSVIFKQGEGSGDGASAPVLPRAERVADPVSQPKVEEVAPVEEVASKPVAEPAPKKKVEQQPAKKPVKKSVKKVVKKATKKVKTAPKKPDVLAIIPPRKPHRQAVPAGEVITKEKALYIALSEAPPSRDVQIYPREGAAGLEYSVIFKTEDGHYEVVVDGVSGVIRDAGAIDDGGGSIVKPGHLPAR